MIFFIVFEALLYHSMIFSDLYYHHCITWWYYFTCTCIMMALFHLYFNVCCPWCQISDFQDWACEGVINCPCGLNSRHCGVIQCFLLLWWEQLYWILTKLGRMGYSKKFPDTFKHEPCCSIRSRVVAPCCLKIVWFCPNLMGCFILISYQRNLNMSLVSQWLAQLWPFNA